MLWGEEGRSCGKGGTGTWQRTAESVSIRNGKHTSSSAGSALFTTRDSEHGNDIRSQTTWTGTEEVWAGNADEEALYTSPGTGGKRDS